MIYLLIVFLLIELLVALLLNGKRIVSPSFISVGVFLFSSIVYAIAMPFIYKADIHLNTVIIIPTLLVFVIAGEKLANAIKSNSPVIIPSKELYEYTYSMNTCVILFLSVFVLAVSFWYAYDIYLFSLTLGNSPGSVFGATLYVRQASNYGTGLSFYSSGLILGQALLISKCIVYFSFFLFVNSSLAAKKLRLRYLLPLFGYLVYILFCDSRGYLIQDIIVLLIIVFDGMSRFRISKKKRNKTIFLLSLLSLSLFFIIFRMLGFRTGTSLNNSFLTNITEYISSGILGLDKALSSSISSNNYFAQSILRNIYIKLNDLGFSFKLSSSNGEFFTFAGGQSNVYTGLFSLIKDLNAFSAIFLFVWSFAIQRMINNVRSRNRLLHSYLIGVFLYPLVMLSIGGEWANVLSITTIYYLVYIFLLNRFFNKNDCSRIKGATNVKRLQNSSNWR